MTIDDFNPLRGHIRDACSVRQQVGLIDEGECGILYGFRFAVPFKLLYLKVLKPPQALAQSNVFTDRAEV